MSGVLAGGAVAGDVVVGGGGVVEVVVVGGLDAGGGGAAAAPGAGANLDDGGGGAYAGCCRGWKKDFIEDCVGFIVVVWGRDIVACVLLELFAGSGGVRGCLRREKKGWGKERSVRDSRWTGG